ncbi:GHMP kinase [Reyranella sp.]|uniref:GHMP family kinase ATP-binding protein n=1 Tax=Reyranella sp. TaxID=1929291 RepID=UPI003BAB1F3B
MILTRTPLRISIAGGGTDLPSYYRRFGGSLISAAITKYIYVGVNQTFSPGYQVKYSRFEHVDTIDEIQHPIVREALRRHGTPPSIEIISLADIPAGTGLGSSGTFAVGLLRALHAAKRGYVTAEALAEEACHIEIDVLRHPIGKQDQYIASYGGVTCFEFNPDDSVTASPLAISNQTFTDLEENLLLFFTGYSRAATDILSDQDKRTTGNDAAMIENLHYVKQLGAEIKVALEQGDTHEFGRLMHDHWEMKRKRSANMSNGDIDRWYEVGRDAGAIGGKMVGAGGGGFLLFYATDRTRLRAAMARENLMEVPFRFDHDGSTTIMRD